MSLLTGIGLVVVIGVMVGPDLFHAIPWWFRKWVGWVAFASVLVGLGRRLAQVRRGDEMPPADRADRGMAWWGMGVGLVLVGLLGVPLLQNPANLGFSDRRERAGSAARPGRDRAGRRRGASRPSPAATD